MRREIRLGKYAFSVDWQRLVGEGWFEKERRRLNREGTTGENSEQSRGFDQGVNECCRRSRTGQPFGLWSGVVWYQ